MRKVCSTALLLVLALVGCSSEEPSTPLLVGAPSITQNPNPAVPLAAIVELTTTEPTSASLELSNGGAPWVIDFDGPPAKTHRLPVLGLAPGKSHSIVVKVKNAVGRTESSAPLTFDAAPLPEHFPPIEVEVSDPASMEPGVTLFDVYEWNATLPGVVEPYGLLVALNPAGEVIWYYQAPHVILDARRLPNGHLLYEYNHSAAAEIDMLGNIVTQWQAVNLGFEAPPGSIPVMTDTMHHEVMEMPNGHLLTLSTEKRLLNNYPSSDTDPTAPPGDANVIGDVVVELARDGTIVQSWPLFDMLDPYRIGYDSLSGFWDTFYPGSVGGTRDWAHANAVQYSERDDSILVSLRNQDAIIKFKRATGKLTWIFGTPENWKDPWQSALLKPVGTMEFPYHQHAPMLKPDGNILLFDNGNYRATPFLQQTQAQDNYSRAVEIRIDESARVATQVWAYGGPGSEIFYSPFLGDADWMPTTGNVLITDGGRVTDAMGVASDAIIFNEKWARILEVTTETPTRKVFEVQIKEAMPTGHAGWSVYRAERLPGLYP